MAKKRVTISDIAKAAGISTATVSRVLSEADYPVSESLRQRVLDIAKELDYKPNHFSRMLKGATSNEIGIIVPSIANPFYAELLSAVEQYCYEHSFVPIICSSYNQKALEQAHIERLVDKQVAGILLSSLNSDSKLQDELDSQGICLVYFDQAHMDGPCDCVTFNFEGAGRMGAEHLIEAGHKEILFCTTPLNRQSRLDLFKGYRLRMEEAGLSPRIIELEEGARADACPALDYEDGKRLADLVLKEAVRPEAILAVNDMTALGLIQELIKHGIAVPGDISVLGFDNLYLGEMLTPKLTTIDQPAAQTGKTACDILIRRIKKEAFSPSQIVYQPRLVSRQSVRKANSKEVEPCSKK